MAGVEGTLVDEEYIEFELLIHKAETREVAGEAVEIFPVRMTLRPPGEADHRIAPDSPGFFVKEKILKWRPRRYKPEDGQRMFEQFFPEGSKVRENWIAAMNRTKGRFRLRLRFDLDPSIAPLQAIPWELLHDASRAPLAYLAAGRDTPVSRFFDGPGDGKTITEERPLKMLVAVAAPDLDEGGHWMPIVRDAEEGIVSNALRDLPPGRVELDFPKGPVSLATLERYLTEERVDILHFVGHGRFDEETGGAVLFADSQNQPAFAEVKNDVVPMFERLGERQPHFVFLASCEQAKRSDEDPFQGLAPSLFGVGVDAVLAMQEKINISTSQSFTRTFYRELFTHGLVDLACNVARSAVISEFQIGSHVPVLFSRLVGNQLMIPWGQNGPRPEYVPETVYVHSGSFLMGSAEPGAPPEEKKQHPVELEKTYWIGKYPVTVRQYERFLRAGGDQVEQCYYPKQAGWQGKTPPEDKMDHPVTGITWQAANAYCSWLSGETDLRYRLPSEAEWERAARGTDGRRYPWGEEFDETRCRPILQPIWLDDETYTDETRPVIFRSDSGQVEPALPDSASPCGAYEMVGHIQEWTSTIWGSNERENRYPYPYNESDGREDPAAATSPRITYRIYRGGRVNPEKDQEVYADRLRPTIRGRSPQESISAPWRGFRIVCEG